MLISVGSPRPLFDLVEQLFVGGEARLALGLTRAGRGAHPLELLLELALARALLLLLDREPRALLLEPAGVVALERVTAPAIELENPLGDVVQEVAIVRDRDDRARVLVQEVLEPRHAEASRWLVGSSSRSMSGALEQHAAQRDAALLAAGEVLDLGVGRRKRQRVHRDLDVVVEVPGVGGVDLVLERALLLEQLVHLVVAHRLAELLAELLEPVRSARTSVTPSSTASLARSWPRRAPAPARSSRS